MNEHEKRKFPQQIMRGGNLLKLSNSFSYTLNWAALAPAANPTNLKFIVQNDSDFMWIGTSYAIDVAGAQPTLNTMDLPLVACTFLLVSEPFMDSEAPLTGLAGSMAREPLALPVPFWIPGGASFTVQAHNYSAATTYDLWLTFHGLKYKKSEG